MFPCHVPQSEAYHGEASGMPLFRKEQTSSSEACVLNERERIGVGVMCPLRSFELGSKNWLSEFENLAAEKAVI